MNRSRVCTGLVALGLAVVAVGCSSDSGSDTASTSASTAASAGATTVAATSTTLAPAGPVSPGQRAAAVEQFVDNAATNDVEIDETCITEAVGRFTDPDFAVFAADPVNAAIDSLSPAGQVLIVEIVNCTGGRPGGTIPAPGGLSTAQNLILEQISTSFDAQGLAYDEQCLSDLVNSVDTATLANDALAAALVTQAQSCVKQ